MTGPRTVPATSFRADAHALDPAGSASARAVFGPGPRAPETEEPHDVLLTAAVRGGVGPTDPTAALTCGAGAEGAVAAGRVAADAFDAAAERARLDAPGARGVRPDDVVRRSGRAAAYLYDPAR